MRVSSRTDYGVRALYDLALHFGQGTVQSREIANRQSMPEAYLHQVLSALNRGGLGKDVIAAPVAPVNPRSPGSGLEAPFLVSAAR